MKNDLPNKFIELSLRPGLFVECQIGKAIIPSHHYSHAIKNGQSIVLSKAEVVQYLKGEEIRKNSPNGYHFVSYMGMNLGVVHSVNGVLKNLYPKGLRINAKVNDSF